MDYEISSRRGRNNVLEKQNAVPGTQSGEFIDQIKSAVDAENSMSLFG